MQAPLEDVVVLEIDNWMAAPSAGAILADMGATVIKIEPLTGDPMRGMGRPVKNPTLTDDLRSYDFQFDVDNRGKKSIAIALDQPEGSELVKELAKKADIFMCNLLTERQAKFGLDPESLFAVNPKIVHATLTGYGTTGPEAWRPGYDVTAFFGRSGLYDSSREGDDGIVPMARPAQGDHTTGLALVGGILGALRMAEKSGQGQTVETSLYETAIWTQASDYAVTAMDKAPVRRRARNQMLAICSNRFPCGDGKWVVFNMLPDEKYWPKLIACLEIEHLLEDSRFESSSTRYKHMDDLVAIIDEALSKRSRDEWGKIFDNAGLIWGPVLGLHEVPADAHAQELGLFPEIEHPELGTYSSVNIPMRFGRASVGPKGPAPQIGEHSAEVLSDFGIDEGRIADLQKTGIVGNGED